LNFRKQHPNRIPGDLNPRIHAATAATAQPNKEGLVPDYASRIGNVQV
jgi:hypothetical protein